MEGNEIQVPMDVIANIVFKQTVELEVLRGQLAQARQVIESFRQQHGKTQAEKKEASTDV